MKKQIFAGNFMSFTWATFAVGLVLSGLCANSSWARDESPTRTVRLNEYEQLFGLSYQTNHDWTYQCGELLTTRVLEVLRGVPSAQRQYILDRIGNIQVVDHVPAWLVGREQPRAEYDEGTRTLNVEFVRIEGQSNPRAYCNDSAYRDVVRLVTRWKEEATAQLAEHQGAQRSDAAVQAGQQQIRGLLEDLQGVQRAPAVDSSSRTSDAPEVNRPADPAPSPSLVPAAELAPKGKSAE